MMQGDRRRVTPRDVDPEAYRTWWEVRGGDDLSLCPCRAPADTSASAPSGLGLCPRHCYDLVGIDRARFAAWILDGTYREHD
jgi:hypothetical protein